MNLNDLTIGEAKQLAQLFSGAEKSSSLNAMIGKNVIVRTYSAGVFSGYLAKKDGQEVILNNARRIWYWDGAASLSQLAMEGTSKPENCKFPCEVAEITLMQVIEIIPCTNKAIKSIKGVKVWKQ